MSVLNRCATTPGSAVSRCWCRSRSPCPVGEVAAASELQQVLQELGLVVDAAGEEQLVIREIPIALSGGDVEAMVRDVLSDLVAYGEFGSTGGSYG